MTRIIVYATLNQTAVTQLTRLPCELVDTFELSLGHHIVSGDKIALVTWSLIPSPQASSPVPGHNTHKCETSF